MREELGRSDKPQTLMDMATIFGRYERANGRLDDMEVSDEINACSVEIDVDVDGVKEPWLLMFKNETHNHPTEIEPLVEQRLVLVEPFVIHYQGDHTFIKRCVFQVLETLQHLFLILALENSLSKSFQKQQRTAILHTETKSVLLQLMLRNTSTQDLSQNVWNWEPLLVQHLKEM